MVEALTSSKLKEKPRMVFEATKGVQVFSTFAKMGLKDELLQCIQNVGFKHPSAIQKRAIVPLVEGKDMIIQSQSGTGKTAVICIGALQIIDVYNKKPQVLILSPSRELAEQTQKVTAVLGENLNVKVHCCVGGKSVGSDIKAFERGVHIVSGSPGRVFDMIKREILSTKNINLLVLDEADVLLGSGFRDVVHDIFKNLSVDVQCVLVSTTFPQDTLELTTLILRYPIRLLAKRDELALENIKQFLINVEKEEYKFAKLCDLFDLLVMKQAVIFCSTRRKVEELSQKMRENGFKVEMIHEDIMQSDREKTLEEFHNGSSKVLITTDMLSRGLDVPEIAIVLNYDMPFSRDIYLHRIGRAGRFGRKAVAINFATKADARMVKELKQYYSIIFEEMLMSLADLI